MAIELTEKIKDYLVEEGLQSGDKLPSETSLAKSFKVARMTLRKGMLQLVNEGYLKKVRPKGTFATEKISQLHQEFTDSEFVFPYLQNTAQKVITFHQQESQPNQIKFWERAIIFFEQENPEIRVELIQRKFSPWEDIESDVRLLPAFVLPRFKRKNLLQPLKLINEERYHKSFQDGGCEYGVPFLIGLTSMIVNQDFFSTEETIPEIRNDFEDFYQQMLYLTQKNPTISFKTSYSYAANLIGLKEINTPLGRKKIFTELGETWERLRKINWQPFHVNKTRITATSALQICSHSMTHDIQQKHKSILIKPQPTSGRQAWYVPVYAVISSQTKLIRESAKFTKFLGSDKIQQLIYDMNVNIPASNHVRENNFNENDHKLFSPSLKLGKSYDMSCESVPHYIDNIFNPISDLYFDGTLIQEEAIKLMKSKTIEFEKNLTEGRYE